MREDEESEEEGGLGFEARFLGVGCVARDGWMGEGRGAARGMRGTCRWGRHMAGFVHGLLSRIRNSFRGAEDVR